jgi:hypothetical protein
MKNKKSINEELDRMKQLSGLLNELDENSGKKIGDIFDDLRKMPSHIPNFGPDSDFGSDSEDELPKGLHPSLELGPEYDEYEKNLGEGVIEGGLTFDDLPSKVKEYYRRNITISVAFVKKDGSVRHIAFRRSLKSYEKSDKEKTDAQTNVLKNNNLMNVYDTNSYIKIKRESGDAALAAKGSFRNFKLENVLAFLCGGELFDMRDRNQIKERFGEEIYGSLTKSMVSALASDERETESGIDDENVMNEANIRKVVRGILKDFGV